MEKELLTFPKQPSSTSCYSGVRVAQSFVFMHYWLPNWKLSCVIMKLQETMYIEYTYIVHENTVLKREQK
jgi:hypothetical protein